MANQSGRSSQNKKSPKKDFQSNIENKQQDQNPMKVQQNNNKKTRK